MVFIYFIIIITINSSSAVFPDGISNIPFDTCCALYKILLAPSSVNILPALNIFPDILIIYNWYKVYSYFLQCLYLCIICEVKMCSLQNINYIIYILFVFEKI